MSKKIKIRLGDLRKLIEQRMNEEEDAAPEPEPFSPEIEKEEVGDSLDAQVDRFLDEYEQEAQSSDVASESKIFHDLMADVLAEDSDLNAGEKKTLDDISIEQFANSVANLVENIENLLEIKNTILRRVMNRLADTYEPSVNDAFEEAMERNHGLAIGKSKLDIEDDFQAPSADRAGSLPSDSSGGGGVGA